MAEVSLVKQLSGPEALDSMLAEVRKHLRMNGRFASHMAYSGYRAEVTIKFYPEAFFIPPVEQTLEVSELHEGGTLSQAATVSATVDVPVRPPNQVREHADMPTPVMTMDEAGNPVEKWVKRGGKGTPKNVVKGGQTGKPEGIALVAEGTSPAQTMVPTSSL